MIVLDIEGTLIDNLWDRNWLNSNIDAIKYWIETEHSDEKIFSIFTFGWLNKSEIDWELIHLIEDRLELRCKFVWTKSTVLKTLTNNFSIENFSSTDEMELSEKFNLNKENGLIAIKELANDTVIDFVDDTIDDKTIFFGNRNNVQRLKIDFINVLSI